MMFCIQVIDCLTSICGPAWLRGLNHIAIFQLGMGDMCINQVQALAANCMYVFPGRWGVDKDGKVLREANNDLKEACE